MRQTKINLNWLIVRNDMEPGQNGYYLCYYRRRNQVFSHHMIIHWEFMNEYRGQVFINLWKCLCRYLSFVFIDFSVVALHDVCERKRRTQCFKEE